MCTSWQYAWKTIVHRALNIIEILFHSVDVRKSNTANQPRKKALYH